MNGKDPKSLIGAIVYLIGKEENIKITQKTLAKMIGVTEVTIRTRSKEIEQIIKRI